MVMAAPYDPRIYWLLVTVSTICFGFVACKPAEENASIATPEDTLNYGDPSTNKTDYEGAFEYFLGNATKENEEEFVDTSVNEGTNHRLISTNPEHEHIGNDIESNDGMFFDTADWVKEAEQWTFKGGDWGLITLPDDNHPDIPNPPVPGPVLLAEGNSMGEVIVSRSEINVTNVTLHFSYFLSNNPASPPVLEVYQIKDYTHSERVAVETTYGQWTTSTLQLPYDGNFEIKFIGQRIVDVNEIALDDIVLRGYYMKNMGTKDIQENDKQDDEEQHQYEDDKQIPETSDDNDKQDDKEQHQQGDDEENHETPDDNDKQDDEKQHQQGDDEENHETSDDNDKQDDEEQYQQADDEENHETSDDNDKQDDEEQHQQADDEENNETSDDNDKQDNEEQHQQGDDEENNETSGDEDNYDDDWFGNVNDDWLGNYIIGSVDGKPTENPVIILNSEQDDEEQHQQGDDEENNETSDDNDSQNDEEQHQQGDDEENHETSDDIDKQDDDEQHQQEDDEENHETSDDIDKQDDDEQHQQGDDEENNETSGDEDNYDDDWFGNVNDDWFGNYIIGSDDGKPTENPVIILNSEGAGELNEFSETIDDPGINGGLIFFVVVSVAGISLLGLLYRRSRGRGHQWDDDEATIYNREDYDDYEGIPYDQSNEDDSLIGKLQSHKSFD